MWPQASTRRAELGNSTESSSRYANGFASGTPADYFSEEAARELVEYA